MAEQVYAPRRETREVLVPRDRLDQFVRAIVNTPMPTWGEIITFHPVPHPYQAEETIDPLAGTVTGPLVQSESPPDPPCDPTMRARRVRIKRRHDDKRVVVEIMYEEVVA